MNTHDSNKLELNGFIVPLIKIKKYMLFKNILFGERLGGSVC